MSTLEEEAALAAQEHILVCITLLPLTSRKYIESPEVAFLVAVLGLQLLTLLALVDSQRF